MDIAVFFWPGLLVVVLIAWALVGLPVWRVWAQGKQGEADLQQAHKEQQIQVSKAQGRLDAAHINKEAAIIEAEAVAAQIEKIGQTLTKHDLYLKWQWIKMMEERPESSVIYVPTEANLPILEAGMRSNKGLNS
jgi:regulator of protease activity HflC (stomatin/prohibitin superfamily)